MGKETYMWEKRPIYGKRDLYIGKTTHPTVPYPDRPVHGKRDLYVGKETYMWEKGPTYRKNDPCHRQIQDDGVNTENNTLMYVSIELYIRTEIHLKGDVAVCCSAMKDAVEGANYASNQCVAVCCSKMKDAIACAHDISQQCVAVCCSVLQCVAARRSAVKDVAACAQ